MVPCIPQSPMSVTVNENILSNQSAMKFAPEMQPRFKHILTESENDSNSDKSLPLSYGLAKDPNLLKCIYCNYTGSSPKHLEKHYKAHTTASKVCRFCNKAFERPSDLVRHIQRHIRKKTTCGMQQICGKQTNSRTMLKAGPSSVKAAIAPKMNVLHCRICGFATTDLHTLNRHMIKIHKRQVFHCEFCTLKFLSEHELLYHKNCVHTDLKLEESEMINKLKKNFKLWYCSICKHSYKYKKELLSHILECHENDTNSNKKSSEILQSKSISKQEKKEVAAGRSQSHMQFCSISHDSQRKYNEDLDFPDHIVSWPKSFIAPLSLCQKPDMTVSEVEHENQSQCSSVEVVRKNKNEQHGIIDDGSQQTKLHNFLSQNCINSNIVYENSAQHLDQGNENNVQHWIKCELCSKKFACQTMCDMHQQHYHKVMTARIDTFKGSILTSTNLVKAQVIGDNQISLDIDIKDTFIETLEIAEIPSVSKLSDVRTLLKQNKKICLTTDAEKFTRTEKSSSANCPQQTSTLCEIDSDLSYRVNISPKSRTGKLPQCEINVNKSNQSVETGNRLPDVNVLSASNYSSSLKEYPVSQANFPEISVFDKMHQRTAQSRKQQRLDFFMPYNTVNLDHPYSNLPIIVESKNACKRVKNFREDAIPVSLIKNVVSENETDLAPKIQNLMSKKKVKLLPSKNSKKEEYWDCSKGNIELNKNPVLVPNVTNVPSLNINIKSSTPILNEVTDITFHSPNQCEGKNKIVTNLTDEPLSKHIDYDSEEYWAQYRLTKPLATKAAAYKCPKCAYGTNALHKYRQHEKAHEHRRYMCKICKRACIKACDLVRHWVSHGVKTPLGAFRCDSCSFSDHNKEIIERHMLCHYYITKKKPWEITNSLPENYEPKLDGKVWLSQRVSRKKHENVYCVPKKVSKGSKHEWNTILQSKSKFFDNSGKLPKDLSPKKQRCALCKKDVPRLLMASHKREHQRKSLEGTTMCTRHKSKFYCSKCGLGFTDTSDILAHNYFEHNVREFESQSTSTDKSSGENKDYSEGEKTWPIKDKISTNSCGQDNIGVY